MSDNGKILYLHHSHIQKKPTDITSVDNIGHEADFDGSAAKSSSSASLNADSVLWELFDILKERGMDPTTQLSGYIITEDPTYLPDYANARALAASIGRDKLLFALLDSFYAKDDGGESDEQRGDIPR